ncbi:helix-turn-helix protein [Pseudaminobacter salicylatoxidans]|uniref:Helix-turn-helix protein n=1 Tax=Pseudaminobacter salicylatoxidans TaxID=93369 RepID=A0A316C5C5_PSESE|nr:helix-turn-helix domain-containing protein [Pseudaminobacter salicylatoxidans]PWJ81548.1 helix-turn-helix protein [Pseudaminobacter salicylatoxidans]
MNDTKAWTWRHAITRSGLPPTTRHVLLTVSLFMNEVGGGCYPTQKQLAEATGLSERAVREHLDVAQRAGWILRSEHGFRGQKWRNHEYQACWPDPQNVEKGAEPDAGPFLEGAEPDAERCGTSRQKVRNVVPPTSPDTNPDTSPPDAQARGGEDQFDILWSGWPKDQLPDNQGSARKAFLALSVEDREKAVSGADLYRQTMLKRSKPRRMIPYLREALFLDFHDNPTIDKDGDFVFKPGHPEWSAWLGVIRREYGDAAVQRAVARGFLCRKTRWPEGYSLDQKVTKMAPYKSDLVSEPVTSGAQ